MHINVYYAAYLPSDAQTVHHIFVTRRDATGACLWEFSIRWERSDGPEPIARILMYQDAWVAYRECTEFFAWAADVRDWRVSLRDVVEALGSLYAATLSGVWPEGCGMVGDQLEEPSGEVAVDDAYARVARWVAAKCPMPDGWSAKRFIEAGLPGWETVE